jgi:ligand-binding sensor domain-containing protein
MCASLYTLYTANLFGQQNLDISERLTRKDGLPTDHARYIFRDSRDNLWLSTYFGLSRYDGNTIYTYTQDNERNSICGTIITSNVLEDKKGLIWTASEHCLSSFNRQYGTWNNYECTIIQKKSGHFLRMVTDGNDRIWIMSNEGLLYVFDLHKKVFSNVTLPGEIGPLINIRISSGSNLLALHNGNKEIAISAAGKTVTDEEAFSGRPNLIEVQEIMSSGKDWIIKSKRGVFRVDRRNEIDTLRYDSNAIVFPYALARQRDRIYAARFSEIIEYDIKTHSKKIYTLETGKDEFISTGDVSVEIDSPGLVWIAGKTGVYHFNLNKLPFHKIQAPNQFHNPSVRSLQLVTPDEIWIGSTSGSINSFKISDPARGLPAQTINLSPFPGENSPINAAFLLSDEYVMVCTYRGLFAYSIQKKKFVKEIPKIMMQLDANFRASIWTVLYDTKGRIWLGTSERGLAVLDTQKNTVRYYAGLDSVFNPVNSCTIWSLLQDEQGSYWIGTNRGLYRGTETAEGKMIFHHYPKSANQLSGQHVWSLISQGNYIWVGTIDGGLNRLDKNTGKFTYYTVQDGLPHISVCSMQLDKKQRLWLMTRKGLSCFDTKQETFTNFAESDGLINNVGEFKTAVQTHTGWIFFGTEKGVFYFHPDNVRLTHELPHIGISSFKVYDKEIRQEILPGETIELGPDDNFFTITAGFRKAGSGSGYNVYYYLKGVDDAWHRLQGNPATFSYNNLSPGRHTLLLQATKGKGSKVFHTMNIDILKQPAWHQTASFRIPFFIFILGLIGSVPYLYFKRSELRRKLLLSEIASLRLQMNPHFIFNSLNSIQDYIVHKENHQANSYLSKFARLMRDILNNSEKRTISVEEESAFLHSYLELENLRFGNRLHYEIAIDQSVDPFDQVPPMLLQPIVENSLKHGLAPKKANDLLLTIAIKKFPHYLSVTVTDNGIGREHSAELRKKESSAHDSLGIKVVQDRLSIMEKITGKPYAMEITDLYDDSHKPTGTAVKLQIPL